jgi:ribosomal protein S28E/S33
MSASSRTKASLTVNAATLRASATHNIIGDMLGLTASTAFVATGLAASVLGMAARATISSLQRNSSEDSTIYTASELQVRQQAICSQVTVKVAQQKLSVLDTAKVTTMATLAVTPYRTTESVKIQQCVDQLVIASSAQQVQLVQQQLLQALEAGNQQVLVQSLVHVVNQASVKAGFAQVKVDIFKGNHRVIATNFIGQALITEIDATDQVNITTEVIGVTDGSCSGILDRFEQALLEEGVVRDGSPERKFTGGVVDLDAAKDFIRSHVKPKKVASSDRTKSAATSEEQAAINRRRQQQTQKAKQ